MKIEPLAGAYGGTMTLQRNITLTFKPNKRHRYGRMVKGIDCLYSGDACAIVLYTGCVVERFILICVPGKRHYANPYNLIENSSFERGTNYWSLTLQ